MKPKLIPGGLFSDNRGTLRYNNDFDASLIKRIYVIENKSVQFERAWQGHKIEQRWFSAINGSFLIKIIEPNHWENPSGIKTSFDFVLKKNTLDFLHIPAGYLTSIKALEEGSQLLVLADYALGEIKDEYKFPLEVFQY